MKLRLLSICFLFSFGLFAQVPSYVPQYGLLGYYPFNGNPNDVSANAAHLTNNGAVLTTDRFGTANAAYSFNGSTQNLINNTPNFTFGPTSNFTYSFWFNRNVTSTTGVIIMNATNAAGNFIWIFQAGPTNMQYGTNKQQSAWIWVPATTTTNVWTHIVCVYNAGTMKLYQDNVLIGTGTFTYTTGVTSANMPLYVGRGVGGNYFNGKIDDVGIWNRALNPCEIHDLFTSSNTLTTVTAGPDLVSCNNQSVTLSGAGAVNYFWNQNITNNVPFTPTTNGTYLVSGFDANGCSAWDETNVTLGQLVVNAGQDVSVCPGDSVTLNATGAQTYTWNNSISNNVPFAVNQSGMYIVTGTNGTCSDSDTLLINTLALPQISAGNDTVVCAGGIVTLAASGGLNYTWNNGVQDAVPFPAFSTQTYIVTGESPAGCVNSDTVEVVANPVPNVVAGNDVSICTGQSVVFTAVGGFNPQWNNGILDGVPFYPTTGGTYIVTGMSNDGCYGTDTLILTVGNLPDISAGTNQTICAGNSVTLSGSGGITYIWNNNITDGQPFTPTQTATYGVTGFSGNGCYNTDSVTVFVNQPSQSTITANGIDVYTLNGIEYATSGTFTQIIPNTAGCDSTITLVLTMDYTGISEWEATLLEVYPNPSNGQFTMVVPTECLGGTAQVVDAFGKEIASIQISSTNMNIDLGKLSKGSYFVSMKNQANQPTRVVIQ
jgi:hypothetical protein